MRLARDSHHSDRAPEPAQDREQRLGLADGGSEVLLRVLKEQWRPNVGRVCQRREPTEQLRVLPRIRAELHLRPIRATEVAGQHEHRHVRDRSGRECRAEALVVGDDPVGQVSAVRTAGHPEPVRIREFIVDQRVDTGEDILHRPIAPIRKVGFVERQPVTLGTAGVAIEDRHSGRGEDLELEEWRPTVERVRSAVDLNDHRSFPGSSRNEPALDGAPVDDHRALGHGPQLEFAREVGVEGRDSRQLGYRLGRGPVAPTTRSVGLRDPCRVQLGERGRRRAERSDQDTAIRLLVDIEAGDIVLTVRDLLQVATVEVEAPHFGGSSDRGREVDRPAVEGRDET